MRQGKPASNLTGGLAGILLPVALLAAACGKVRDEPRSTSRPDSEHAKGGVGGPTGGEVTPPAIVPDGGGGPETPTGPADASPGNGFVCDDPSPLHRIPGRVPCGWAFPEFPGRVVDPDKLNVQYEDNVGPRYLLTFPAVPSASACDARAAWYYDLAGAPTAIVGCPALCEFAGSEDAGLPGRFGAILKICMDPPLK